MLEALAILALACALLLGTLYIVSSNPGKNRMIEDLERENRELRSLVRRISIQAGDTDDIDPVANAIKGEIETVENKWKTEKHEKL